MNPNLQAQRKEQHLYKPGYCQPIAIVCVFFYQLKAYARMLELE